MNQALLIKDGTKSIINADTIESRRDYLENYVGHLFCPNPNCSARLSFALTPTFKVKKIFKTAKHSEHSDECPHKVLYDASQRRITSGTVNCALSDRHKRDILKGLFYQNEEHDSPTPTYSKPIHRKNPDPKGENTVTSPRTVASISPDAEPVAAGQREPTVRKRKCSDILSEDVGKLLGMSGYSTSAIISNDYVEILIGSTLSISFYNAFRDASPAAFSLIKRLANDINSKHMDLFICFIGVVEEKKERYEIQIMDPSLISFNDVSIFNYYITV